LFQEHPHHCEVAEMNLRVIGAGLPRTGTHSLKLALEHLLGGRCYHMSELPGHPFDLGPRWNLALAGERPDWNELLSNYIATVDWPASMLWRELSEVYPDALVLLSIRDTAETWWQSANETILPVARRALAPDWKQGRGLLDLLERFTGRKGWDDPTTLMAAYERHNNDVRDAIPQNRLLVWNASDGWAPLCKPLNLPVPDDPFPWVNRRSEWGDVMPAKLIHAYLEIGAKRTFAGALDWPGWCRSGQDEKSALQALVDYGARYARVVSTEGKTKEFEFRAPADVASLIVMERLKGNATTDFGAPDLAPAGDAKPVNEAELARLQAILKACWRAFDRATRSAEGKELRKGPRGGGRELEGVIRHVLGSDGSYRSSLGGKVAQDEAADLGEELKHTRKAILEALKAAAHGEVAERGPRGGIRWKPRYFVRRVAWHVLDHAWEIEDRIENGG
jgi:hypothetical protein